MVSLIFNRSKKKLTHLNLENIPSNIETKEYFFTLDGPLDHRHHLQKISNPQRKVSTSPHLKRPRPPFLWGNAVTVASGVGSSNLQTSTICCDDFRVDVF